MAMDSDRTRTEAKESPSPADGAKRARRQGSSWVDKVYDVIDERIGEAMKRLSE